ncbi:hypothetical protein DC487_12060 [Sphingobacterium corticibacter]|uniref:Uncharacterized protein n=2 Tax=Sphingobacterium corticibacter TaxID=2171749 RepID=A0A2T8HHC9_9SPHI|nr:hypothetical protein DC487_12060 [Sphingobacterium corticibacter]
MNDNQIIEDATLIERQLIYTEFAKAFSKALENKEIRDLIKDESIKMFNRDHDVLFQLVKDQTLSNGSKVIDFVSQYSELEDQRFKELIDEEVLLTIFVPSITSFSPDKWNTVNQIPVVAVRNERDMINNRALYAYDNKQNKIELSYFEQPDIPIVVIKTNERIGVANESASNEKKSQLERIQTNSNTLKSTKKGNLVYLSEGFAPQDNFISSDQDIIDNGTTKNTINRAVYNYTPQSGYRLVPINTGYSFNRQLKLTHGFINYDVNYHRDLIYYNLKNNLDSGFFDSNYSEYITGFYLNNANSFASIDALNKDWTDGFYDIYVTILFVDGTSVGSIRKGFSVSKSDLIKDGNLLYYNINPIEITSWDVQRYGSIWKILLEEYNPGAEKTVNQQVSSKFTTNFKADVGFNIGIFKIGGGGGGSSERTVTETYQYKTTITSFDLGESILNFYNPVLTTSPLQRQRLKDKFGEKNGGIRYLVFDAAANAGNIDFEYYDSITYIYGQNTGFSNVIIQPIWRYNMEQWSFKQLEEVDYIETLFGLKNY